MIAACVAILADVLAPFGEPSKTDTSVIKRLKYKGEYNDTIFDRKRRSQLQVILVMLS